MFLLPYLFFDGSLCQALQYYTNIGGLRRSGAFLEPCKSPGFAFIMPGSPTLART